MRGFLLKKHEVIALQENEKIFIFHTFWCEIWSRLGFFVLIFDGGGIVLQTKKPMK